MYKKINIFINGRYTFSTCKYRTCSEAVKDLRATKHVMIASIPNKYITIYDYDTIKATYRR